MILIVISITIPAFAKYLCADACTGPVFNATAGSSQLCLNSLLACTVSRSVKRQIMTENQREIMELKRITEKKNSLDGLNIRFEMAEEKTIKL